MDAIFSFVRNFRNLRFEDLSEKVVAITKDTLLDTVGVAIAGTAQRGAEEIYEIVSEWEMKGRATVICHKRRLPAPYAAQINATLIQACDYDDVHEKAIVHPSVITVSTSIAAAEEKGGIGGKEFICALAAGADMICRLGLALTVNPITTGFHMTSIFGYIVSALCAGRILGLTEEEMVNAAGIAYHQCSGNGQAVKDGGLTKRLGPGFAVRAGIMACIMAKKGLTGAKNILEGEWGLFHAYFQGRYNRETLTRDLGEHFEGVNVSIKPYPCCRGVHASIDAALELVNKYGIEREELEEVVISTGEANHALLCLPRERKIRPENPVDTQFSIPWGVGVAISKRKVGMEYFTKDALEDREILSITKRVRTEIEPAFTRTKGDEPAKVRVITKDGRTLSAVVGHPLGSPERPISFEECVEKFKSCLAFSRMKISEEKIKKIVDSIYELEKIRDVRAIFDLL